MLGLGVLAIACLVGLAVFAAGLGGFGTPSSEEVVEVFEDEGLEVGESYPVDQVDGWQRSPVEDVRHRSLRRAFLLEGGRRNDVRAGIKPNSSVGA